MEAPEKIYLDPALDAFTEALSEKTEDDVEYIRTDVFIEKACDWLGPVFKNLAGHYSGAELLDDFKNYMKGE